MVIVSLTRYCSFHFGQVSRWTVVSWPRSNHSSSAVCGANGAIQATMASSACLPSLVLGIALGLELVQGVHGSHSGRNGRVVAILFHIFGHFLDHLVGDAK